MGQRLVLLLVTLGLLFGATTPVAAQDDPASSLHTPVTDLAVTEPVPATFVHPWLRLSINIAAKELRVIENDQVVARYQVAIGAPRYPTPELSDDINHIIWNPSWIPPDSPWAAGAKVTPPGPNNPLGPVKMPITSGILIHGTNKPNSVGQAASHGCFRMRSDEAATLAWYIQERASAKTDPSLWEQYRKFRYRTVWVKLDQTIPVDVVYRAVEVDGEHLKLYPDVYRRVRNWPDEILGTLAAQGINVDHIQPTTIQHLVTQLRQGATHVPLRDLLDNRVAIAK